MNSKETGRSKRKQYSPQFKEQVLERAEREGVAQVAEDLGLQEALIYSWRAKKKQTGIPFEDQKIKDAELSRLKRELARAQEEVAFLKKAAAYFAKESKKDTP